MCGARLANATVRLVQISWRRVGGTLIRAYLLYLAAGFFVHRWLVFPGAGRPAPDGRPDGVEVRWLDTSAGRVEAWYLPPLNGPARGTVLYAHGNGGLIDATPDRLRPLRARGWAVATVEYPGYGRSAGSPSRAGILEAFEAGYDWLVAAEKADPARIVFMGFSLGGGVICDLTARRPSVALILQSTFTDLAAMTAPFLYPWFLVRDPFDCVRALKRYEAPVMIVHGTRDETVPVAHARALHLAIPRAEIHIYDCGHNDCPPGARADRRAHWDRVDHFMARAAGEPGLSTEPSRTPPARSSPAPSPP